MPRLTPPFDLLLNELDTCHPCSGLAVERELKGRDGKTRLRPEIFHALYAHSLIPHLKKQILSQRSKVEVFMREMGFHFLDEKKVRQVLPDWSVFNNINTPEEACAAGIDLPGATSHSF